MTCEKIRELLLTDYVDGRVTEEINAYVQKHLQECEACRRFEEKIQLVSLRRFKDTREAIPDSIWSSIKEKIGKREAEKLSLLEQIKERLKVFLTPRPAFALAATMVIFLVAFGAVTKYKMDRSRVAEYFSQQSDFLGVLYTGESNGTRVDNLGTSLEEYFFAN
jgi:predicted anti-sigma-YlaC factor YlaD